jgi:multidrug resistance efflux pump
MEKLPLIPTPWTTRWREFRYQFLPIITFALLVAAVAWMWRDYVVPPNVVAQVEPISVRISANTAGTLVRLDVERYQHVTNGQVLGVIETMSTNMLQASMAVIEGDLRLMEARMGLNETRIEQNYLQELLRFQADKALLENTRVNMKKAEADFLRVSNLFNAKPPLESVANYDLARYTYLALCTNVAVTEWRLSETERILPRLMGLTNDTAMAKAVQNDTRAQLEQLRAEQHIVLRAPLDGTITTISNRVGEAVLPGRAILSITALESTNILAYARQPLNLTPKVGDTVQISAQTFKRRVATGKVIQVGTQLAPIDLALLGPTGRDYRYDLGLPFLVTLPKELNLAPGERVDVVLSPSK